tara:strand:- start:3299 stop:3838 length:540 start_codon:yes stop_codon:yes gene_type:complete
MYKNIIFDRDGIINEIVERDGVISSPWSMGEFRFLEASKAFLKKISSFGKLLFIATNQPDIARGNLKISTLKKMHQIISKEYKILEIFFCPHDNSDDCNCRKPSPGMLCEIIKKYKLVEKETLMIGDSFKDIEAASAANIDSVFYLTSYNKHHLSVISKNKNCTVVKSFSEIEYLINFD